MGQVKSAFHDIIEQDDGPDYAPPSVEIYLLMDCSIPVGAYMYKALAEHDMDICIQGAERGDEPDMHDYWVKPITMALVAE